MRIERTKSGLPAMWEKGGAGRNTGEALCLADRNGAPKTALFVRHGGPLACGQHALFVVRPGDLVCHVTQWRGDETISLYRLGAEEDAESMEHTLIAEFDEGEWSADYPAEAADLIEAACRKARAYHCRSMYYGKEKERI